MCMYGKDLRPARLTTNDVSHFNCIHLPHISTGKLELIRLPPLKPSSLVVLKFEGPGLSPVSDNK